MRLGKAERALRKQQWKQFRELKAAVILENTAQIKTMPTSKGFRLSPDFRQSSALRFKEPSNMPRINYMGSDTKPYGKASRLPAGTGSYRR